jgi:hypothetical protein
VPVEEEKKLTYREQLIEKFWGLCRKMGWCHEGCPLNGRNICMHIDEKGVEEIKETIRTLEKYLEMKEKSNKPTETTTTPSAVSHPSHYNQGGIECIDAIKAATVGLNGFEGFCAGNAIKYLFRWKHKNGVEDLKKCQWYVDRLIEEESGNEDKH